MTRINWEIITGTFVVDAESGELRFRTSMLVPEVYPFPAPVALGMVYINVVTVDRWLPDLTSMLLTNTPLETILVEMGL